MTKEVKTVLKGIKLTKDEYVEQIEKLNIEGQELQSKLNQVQNFMRLLKLKKIKLNEEINQVDESRRRATEIFKQIKYVRELDATTIEQEWENLIKKTGLEKSLTYKEENDKQRRETTKKERILFFK